MSGKAGNSLRGGCFLLASSCCHSLSLVVDLCLSSSTRRSTMNLETHVLSLYTMSNLTPNPRTGRQSSRRRNTSLSSPSNPALGLASSCLASTPPLPCSLPCVAPVWVAPAHFFGSRPCPLPPRARKLVVVAGRCKRARQSLSTTKPSTYLICFVRWRSERGGRGNIHACSAYSRVHLMDHTK